MANLSRLDIINAESAMRYFNDRWQTWIRTSGAHPHLMWVDLLAEAMLPGGWQLNRFLMGRPCGEELFDEQVATMVLVIRYGQPAIMIQTRAHPQERYITWHGAKCRFY